MIGFTRFIDFCFTFIEVFQWIIKFVICYVMVFLNIGLPPFSPFPH